MNQRQSLKEASKHIVNLEYQNLQYALDVKAYVGCIHSMIKGESPCEWCEDQRECQKDEKTNGKGCQEWWLAFREPLPDDQVPTAVIDLKAKESDADESKGILPASKNRRK